MKSILLLTAHAHPIIAGLLLWCFASLQVADAYTTNTVLKAGGRELNPIMRWLFKQLGVIGGFLITKVSIVALVAVALWYGLPLIAMPILIAVYGVLAWHNWTQIGKVA